MKVGMRKPSIKKSVRARTTGRLKRSVKRTINPFYGKKGMGFIRNPKKAIYNKIYHKTTFGVSDIAKGNVGKVASAAALGAAAAAVAGSSDKNSNTTTPVKKKGFRKYYWFWIVAALLLPSAIPGPNLDNSGCLEKALLMVALILAGLYFHYQRLADEKAEAEEIAQAQYEAELMQRQLEQQEAEEAEAKRQRQIEFDSKHGKLCFAVAGVTFKNDDGSKRQEYLQAIYDDPDRLGNVCFKEYEYNGEPAFHVFYDEYCIGNVPKAVIPELVAVEDKIENIYLSPACFENDSGKTVYRADISIQYSKDNE